MGFKLIIFVEILLKRDDESQRFLNKSEALGEEMCRNVRLILYDIRIVTKQKVGFDWITESV